MSTEIAVCYTDVKVVRVSWADKLTLKRDGVLSIAVLCDGDPQFECRSISHDFYQLVWDDNHFCLTGHDGDYAFYSFTDFAKREWRFPFDMRSNTIEFIGAYTDTQEDWQKALNIYSDRTGSMY